MIAEVTLTHVHTKNASILQRPFELLQAYRDRSPIKVMMPDGREVVGIIESMSWDHSGHNTVTVRLLGQIDRIQVAGCISLGYES